MKYVLDLEGQEFIDALHAEYSRPLKYKDYQLEEIAEHYRNMKKGLDKQDNV